MSGPQSSPGDPVRVGVIGLGYWGPNVARNLHALPGCELAWCCDADTAAHDRWREDFTDATFTTELDDLLADDSLQAIAVTTPVPTHAGVGERVLAAGKDCFVEKPLALTPADAEKLCVLAEDGERVLMTGHLLEYHPGVEAMIKLVGDGELGDPLYMYGQRLNLGKARADENALWSLGAHDVSVLLAVLGEKPSEVSCDGGSYLRDGVEDVVFANLKFPSGVAAHLHLSWLDPRKERQMTVVGSKRMATFDDMAPTDKLTIFDKGFDPDALRPTELAPRSGETTSPTLPETEPLRIELEHFINCVRDRSTPRSDGRSGLAVVQVLDALQRSLDAGGAKQTLTAPAAA